MSLILHNLKHFRTHAEYLLAWERSTYETAEASCSEDQTQSPSRPMVDQSAKPVQTSLSPDLLEVFHRALPQELRDLVYAHIIGSEGGTWTVQRHGPFFRFDRRTADVPTSIIPRSLQVSQDPMFSMVCRELANYFFSTNTIVLRYRYDSTVLDIITRLCRHTGCRPAQHIKRLQIFFCPPECAEDDVYCDEDAEFEWHHLFPRPKNARSLAQRRQLETDLRGIGRCINKECETEFTFIISKEEWQALIGPGAMDEWLCSIKDTDRIRLLWRDWEEIMT